MAVEMVDLPSKNCVFFSILMLVYQRVIDRKHVVNPIPVWSHVSQSILDMATACLVLVPPWFPQLCFFYTFKGGPNFINLWDGDYGQFYMVLPHEPCVIENGYYSITVKQWVYVVVKNDWYYIVWSWLLLGVPRYERLLVINSDIITSY